MVLLSASRIDRYKKCARSYRYRYIDKLPSKPFRETILGSFSHSILDFWAERFQKTSDLRNSVKLAYLDAKKVLKGNIAKEDLEIVKQWIRSYVISLEEKEIKILDHEKSFEFVIDNKFCVRGTIDRIDEVDSDTIRIIDYKTGKSHFVGDKQILIYGRALIKNPLYKDKKIIGTFIFLNENCKTVSYEITPVKIEKITEYFRNAGEKIISEKEWKPTFSPLCSWCDYKFKCMKENNNLC